MAQDGRRASTTPSAKRLASTDNLEGPRAAVHRKLATCKPVRRTQLTGRITDMDNDIGEELARVIVQLATKLDSANAKQDDTNDLLRGLIDALNTNSQELLEIKEEMRRKS